MPDPDKSPAVQSFLKEARERSASKDPLEDGLEDTFPASDPISITHSAAASVRDAHATGSDDTPLVDEALRSTGDIGRNSSTTNGLRRDAARVSRQASEVASGAKSLARAQANSALQTIEDSVRERPLTAVAIVAGLAYLWGATR